MLSLRLPDASSLRFPAGAGISRAPRRPVTLRCFWKEDSDESSSSSVSHPTDILRTVQNSVVIACLRADSMELAVEAARAALSGGISLLEIVISTPGVFEAIQQLVREHPSSLIGLAQLARVTKLTRRSEELRLNESSPESSSFKTLISSKLFPKKSLRRHSLTDISGFENLLSKAGTVLNSKDAENAVHAGARFLLSPATIKEIIDDLRSSSVLYLPGVMTPTEVLTAYIEGARAVKVYPVSLLGGPKYISALKKPFPNIPMVASQGITIDILHQRLVANKIFGLVDMFSSNVEGLVASTADSIEQYIHCGASAVVLSDAIFNKESMRQRDFDTICQLAGDAVSRANNAIQRRKREMDP